MNVRPARMLLLTLTTALALYTALVACVFMFQGDMIYYPQVPGRALTASPADLGLRFEKVRLTTEDGEELVAWYVPGQPDALTVLFCHGNGGNISLLLGRLKILNDMGLAVLLFDYRGYGESSGIPSEKGTYADARAAWRYLTQTRQIPPARVLLFGESLGGAIAAHLATEVVPAALITSSAFTSVPDMGRAVYWYLPLDFIARIRYPTAEHIQQVHVPALVMHSRDDEIVPFSHGEALFRRANEPKKFVEIRGDHNGGFLISEDRIRNALREFLDAHQLRTANPGLD